MTKTEMLKIIARHGYNVGFGAKKNYATYDLISKGAGWISFISFAIGVFALFIPELASNIISATLIIFSVVTMYIQGYDSEKNTYSDAGRIQTELFNELEVVYRDISSTANFDYSAAQERVNDIMGRFYKSTISKQIFGSNWYAHYKFFNEFEQGWVEDELSLTIKDKIPLSFRLFLVIIVILAIHFNWLIH